MKSASTVPPGGPKGGRSGLRLGVFLATAAVIGVVTLFLFNRDQSNEAQAAMLVTPAPVDGERAYSYLKKICEIGPRVAGSEANARQRKMVAAHFEKYGAKLVEQPFTGRDPKTGATVSMMNVVASWYPERRDRVVVGAHYDTRPFPDEDADPAKRKLPFLGANDCASGVALLMEMAQHVETLQTPWGVDFVIFDGEEIVYGHGRDGQVGEYFLGSKEFAKRYAIGVDSRTIDYRYAAGIVLDMVGGKNLAIDKEENSMNLAPELVRDVWRVAASLKAKGFRNRAGVSVSDDHLPLNNAGIPTIDLIHFPYKYWHTSQDLPENCSPASLEEVGKVVTGWLARPKPRAR